MHEYYKIEDRTDLTNVDKAMLRISIIDHEHGAGSNLTTDEIARAEPEEIQWWNGLIQSGCTTIPNKTFRDMFPLEAIKKYRGHDNKPLPGLRYWDGRNLGRRILDWLFGRNSATCGEWVWIDPDDVTLTVWEQENYVRYKLLPTFAWKVSGALAIALSVTRQAVDEFVDAVKGVAEGIHPS